MLAAMGAQWFESFDAINESWIRFHQSIKPIDSNSQSYRQLFDIYQSVYQATQPITQALSQFK